MKKKIAILGSTGSIGNSTVEIIKNNKKDFDVIFLSTNNFPFLKTILPKVEERIKNEWSYSNNEDDTPDEIDSLDDLINEKVSTNA